MPDGPPPEAPAVGLGPRLGVVAVVGVLLLAAMARWAADAGRTGGGGAYIAMGLVVLAACAGAHIAAVRRPERPALEGTAWVLTIVAVLAVGGGSVAALAGYRGY